MNIDKTKLSWQLVVLSCICLFPMGAYFVYDAPATLMRYFKAALEMNQSEYMSYYTWYSAPNIVFCIAAGVLVDNVFGRRLSGIIFCTCVFLGQTLFTFGMSKTPDSKSWAYLSKIGRTIIGIGVESIAVTSKVYITWWYKDTPLYSIAFAICIAFWRVSSSFSLMTMLPYYNNHNSVVPNDGSTLEFNIFTCQGCEKTEKAFLNQEIGEAYQEDTMYYCYDQQVLDSCMMVTSEQINHWNVHNATNLSRTKACSQFDEATQQFLNASGLIQHGCFDPKTFVFNLEKCHCLDSQYVPVENAWEWADSMASQYEIESDKFTSAKIDSLRDPFYWSSGFGEYLTGDDLADKIEYFSLLNYQYCADKQDISLEFGRYSAEEGWSVGDFVKKVNRPALYGYDSKCEKETSTLYPIPEQDTVQRVEDLASAYYLMLLVPVAAMGVACILYFIDATAENNYYNAPDAPPRPPKSTDTVMGNLINAIKAIKDIPLNCWILYIMVVVFYVPVFTFIAQAPKFFEDYVGLEATLAAKATSQLYLFSIVMTPVMGFIVKLTGNELVWLCGAYILVGAGHFVMLSIKGTIIGAILGMFLCSAAYGLVGNCLWPMIGLLVNSHMSGKAYGLAYAVQQVGLTAAAAAVGILADSALGWGGVETFFIGNAGVGLGLAFYLLTTIGRNFPKSKDVLDKELKDNEEEREALKN